MPLLWGFISEQLNEYYSWCVIPLRENVFLLVICSLPNTKLSPAKILLFPLSNTPKCQQSNWTLKINFTTDSISKLLLTKRIKCTLLFLRDINIKEITEDNRLEIERFS